MMVNSIFKYWLYLRLYLKSTLTLSKKHICEFAKQHHHIDYKSVVSRVFFSSKFKIVVIQ